MYLDVGYINDINISIAQTSLGVVQSQNYRTITTNSTNLLSILKVGQAVKIGNEIKRVSSIKNNSTFSVTQQWDDVHVGQTAYKDFTSNDDGSLYQDSFSNYLHIASSIGGIRTLERCTKFEGCNSLFIYDDADSENEKQESFIIGTYDLSKDDTRNVQSVLIMKPNRSFNYIINMVETKQSFTGNSTSISSMQNNVYGIWLNGKYLPSTDWYRSGNNIVFNSITTLRRNNYIRVLHSPSSISP